MRHNLMTRALCFALSGLFSLTACSEKKGAPPKPDNLKEAIREVAERQSVGMKGATLVVHRVYNYGKIDGVDLLTGEKIIAVDAEMRKPNEGFDPDDLDILDIATKKSHENMGWRQMSLEGRFVEDASDEFFRKDFRCLYLYVVPAGCEAVLLSYWDDMIPGGPHRIGSEGPRHPQHK